MALTRAKLEELIAAGEIEVGGGVNPNILHNWDFRNPVNQRGVSGQFSSIGYYLDRWVNSDNSGQLYISPTNVRFGGSFSTYGSLWQRLEGSQWGGRTYTASLLLTDGTIISATLESPTQDNTNTEKIVSGVGFRFYKDSGVFSFMFRNLVGSALYASAVKLELGPVSTLHLDPPMDYTTERLKCLRYCRRYDGYLVRPVEIYTTSARFSLFGEVAMRVTPTISGTFKWYTLSTVEIPVTTWGAVRDGNLITIMASGATGGQDGFLFASGAILSADL